MNTSPDTRSPFCCLWVLRLAFFWAAIGAVPLSATPAADAVPKLSLKKGDRIVLVGNTLAERMQHFGHFETMLHRHFPEHQLVVRHMGWSADEITLMPRSLNFGSLDKHLEMQKPDVILAFFGFNESFAGPEGIDKFQKDLTNWIAARRSKKYNGESAPQVALISPIAREDIDNAHLPACDETNEQLSRYTEATARVAKEQNVPYVDLFQPSREMMSGSEEKLTTNGIHLNEKGYQQIAPLLLHGLFDPLPLADAEVVDLDRLRAEVNEKNLQFWYRYRAVNGYYIYGARSRLWNNREVMETERRKLDDMVSNRDRRIWQVAAGSTPPANIDDTGTTDLPEVPTNFQRPIQYESPDETISKFTLAEGYQVNLFASEVEFPELQNPAQIAFDGQGRLWVCTMPSYPQYLPPNPVDDKLLILEDTDGDGKADKRTVFADGLHVPTGFELGDGGVYVAQQPDLLFLKDTDGDGKADVRRRILSGFDSADTHCGICAFTWGPGGALYMLEGIFHYSQIETPHGPVRCSDAGVFRYEPRSEKLDVFVAYPFANPWGHVFDRWGQSFVADASDGSNYFAAAFSGHVEYPHKHRRMKSILPRRVRPSCGSVIVANRHFPDEAQGNYLLNNCIGFQGVLQHKMRDEGSGFAATEIEPLISSSDPNFRPVDLQFGLDGALYICDWYNPLIGHMQHSLRDPARDHTHGRIWRVTHKSRDLVKPEKIVGAPIPALLDLLKVYEDRTRYHVRRELRNRPTDDVLSALDKWIAGLDPKDEQIEHHMLEALWVHQHHNAINEHLLRRMLQSPDARARAAATRVLCYWRDQISDALALLERQAGDADPRVRLEAVRAASFFREPEAARVVVEALLHPQDDYLKYTLKETIRTQSAFGNNASALVELLNSGRLPADRMAFVVKMVCERGDAKDLAGIYRAVVTSDLLPAEARHNALLGLREAALVRKVRPDVDPSELRDLIQEERKHDSSAMLIAAIELSGAWKVAAAGDELAQIAVDPKTKDSIRRIALEALVTIDPPLAHDTVIQLTSANRPENVRYLAAAILTQLDIDQAAERAAQVLSTATADHDPTPLVRAFLTRPEGADRLAEVLSKVDLSADVAKLALRYMYSVGRSDAALSEVLTRAANISTETPTLSAEQTKQLVADVLTHGDPARGEQVFRRSELSCMNCHSLGGVGGKVGPQLTAVGSSSPVEYLISALLTPSKEIKEGYVTAHVLTDDGKSHLGILSENTDDRLVLKDATGKVTVIPKADIDGDWQPGQSLMPTGLVQFMTRRELIDLTRFLSELGRPGKYAVSESPTIRRWRVLRDVPAKLSESIPNIEQFGDHVLRRDATSWSPAYSLVSGALPLDDLASSPEEQVIYLQGEIMVDFAGQLGIALNSSQGVTLWIGDEQVPVHDRFTAPISSGRQKLTLRIDRRKRASDELRLDLFRNDDSTVRVRMIGGA
ncbi:MAG TPA: PVC-type heme-binding CxxCH protein [Pirellulales bacterium]|nr:PVC-type heme-binding CxxCH protein [Pirellulales bacterium]